MLLEIKNDIWKNDVLVVALDCTVSGSVDFGLLYGIFVRSRAPMVLYTLKK